MPSTEPTIKVFLGHYVVEDVGEGTITINIGQNVRITMHLGFSHNVECGQTLPLYTKVPYAIPSQPPVQ